MKNDMHIVIVVGIFLLMLYVGYNSDISHVFSTNVVINSDNFYNIDNLPLAMSTAIIISFVSLTAFMFIRREENKRIIREISNASYVTLIFATIDILVHTFLPQFQLLLVRYTLIKSIYLFPMLFILLTYIKDIRVISAIAVALLEYRFYLIYLPTQTGSYTSGLPIFIVSLVFHYMLLWGSLYLVDTYTNNRAST